MQDAVARRNHVDVLERLLGPVDEVEAVFVATVFDRAVLRERVRIETAAFDRQRVVDHQLRRHHRVDQRRVAALRGDRIAQAGQVDQRGLAEDVVADHARREPRKIQVALALDDLPQRRGQHRRLAAAHEVLGQHARRVRQLVVGAGLDRVDGGARVEEIELGAGQAFAVCSVHGVGNKRVMSRRRSRSAPPCEFSGGAFLASRSDSVCSLARWFAAAWLNAWHERWLRPLLRLQHGSPPQSLLKSSLQKAALAPGVGGPRLNFIASRFEDATEAKRWHGLTAATRSTA